MAGLGVRNRRTTLLMGICMAVLLGIAAGYRLHFTQYLFLFLPLTLTIFAAKRSRTVLIIGLLLFGFTLGLIRGSTFHRQLDKIRALEGKKVTLQVVATSDAIYGKRSQMEFTAGNAQLRAPYRTALAGSYKISGFGETMIYRGDRVIVQGKLFTSRGSNQARVSFAQLERTGLDTSFINQLRRRFAAAIQSSLPEPAASLALGLLIGQRSTLPPDVLAALTAVGLVHIVAVSGYNVTILGRAVQRLKFTRSKYQQLVITLAMIGLFITVTGFSASVVRAGIVSVLGLLAWYYGRTIKPLLLILFPAALTTFINPFYLWSDIGWYLSFLAFFGILIVAPMLLKRIYGIKKQPAFIVIVVETLSAELMTLPLVMAVFGKVSIVALIANILVVPIVPFAMLFASIAAVVNVCIPVFTGLFAVPALYVTTYIIDVAGVLSRISSASVKVALTSYQALFMYVIIAFVLSVTFHKNLVSKKVLERGAP